eukprot:1160669-Pelagomonas_calceolata.AAC.4
MESVCSQSKPASANARQAWTECAPGQNLHLFPSLKSWSWCRQVAARNGAVCTFKRKTTQFNFSLVKKKCVPLKLQSLAEAQQGHGVAKVLP